MTKLEMEKKELAMRLGQNPNLWPV